MKDVYVQDVVIHTTKPSININKIPFEKPFQLTSDLCICRLTIPIVDKIFFACRPKGYEWSPYRQFGQLYSFVRENFSDNDDVKWDTDKRLQRCIALSRIVHPTSVSFKYSARVFTDKKQCN